MLKSKTHIPEEDDMSKIHIPEPVATAWRRFISAANIAGFDTRDWELVPAEKGRPWTLMRGTDDNTPFPRVLGTTRVEVVSRLNDFTTALTAVVQCSSRLEVGHKRIERFGDMDDIEL